MERVLEEEESRVGRRVLASEEVRFNKDFRREKMGLTTGQSVMRGYPSLFNFF
jgi:hypothetical protein